MHNLPPDHPIIKAPKIGVLLVNLGTPDSTSWHDIRRYLKEFLSDRRVIEVNPLLWQMVLRGIILNTRPHKTARAYKSIWRMESNESPLRYYTRRQAELVSEQLTGSNIIVRWAMRYGSPSIDSQIKALHEEGCQRIALLPLYPHYSAATTGTVCDETFRSLMRLRWQPTLRVADPYHDHPAYITALADSVMQHLATLSWQPELILTSYHGLPQEYFDKGDPYHCFCHKTTRLLQEALAAKAPPLTLTFQSRFGPRAWLKPYTDHTLIELAQKGVKRIAVICPGFAADCVETLEEIAIAGAEIFHEAGGEEFTLIPCLNDNPAHIDLLATLAHATIQGWTNP